MKQLPDGKPSGSCFAYYLLPTFIEKEWRVIVSLGVFLKRGVDRNFFKPCFSKQLFHFSWSVKMRLKIHIFLLKSLLSVIEFIESGSILRLCIGIVGISGFQNQFQAILQAGRGSNNLF